MKFLRSRLLPYGVALLLVLLAVLLALLLRRSEKQIVYPLSFVAVLASTWFGGLGPGLFAALLMAMAGLYYLLPPTGSFRDSDAGGFVRLWLVAGAAILVSFLHAKLQAARRRMEAGGSETVDGRQ
jgi:K+-sensing histidine kinase KdpD